MFISKGRDFCHGHLCWRIPLPSHSARHQSLWDWWPLEALCSCTFLLCHTQRQIFLAEAPLCAESSYSLMCFKFVSIFYGGLQPLMQMCNGNCKSALQGENTSGAWFSFTLVLAALCCTGSVKGPPSGYQGCVKPQCILSKATIWTRIQYAWLTKGKEAEQKTLMVVILRAAKFSFPYAEVC